MFISLLDTFISYTYIYLFLYIYIYIYTSILLLLDNTSFLDTESENMENHVK